MRIGERATPREHRLARCSPDRSCVLRFKPLSTRNAMPAGKPAWLSISRIPKSAMLERCNWLTRERKRSAHARKVTIMANYQIHTTAPAGITYTDDGIRNQPFLGWGDPFVGRNGKQYVPLYAGDAASPCRTNMCLNWHISRAEFPQGLQVGLRISAYYADGKFILVNEDK